MRNYRVNNYQTLYREIKEIYPINCLLQRPRKKQKFINNNSAGTKSIFASPPTKLLHLQSKQTARPSPTNWPISYAVLGPIFPRACASLGTAAFLGAAPDFLDAATACRRASIICATALWLRYRAN